MKVKSESEVAQSYLTLRDPMDRSLPGSAIYGIFQTREPEWGPLLPETTTTLDIPYCFVLQEMVYCKELHFIINSLTVLFLIFL